MPDLLAGRAGEVAVIGLAKSGRAAALLLARNGHAVYASDASDGPTVQEAAAALRGAGVTVQVGGHDLTRIGKAALVVLSPGVPPSAPPVLAARATGVPMVSEIEVALRALPGLKTIAITGTNGKTTTTSLIAQLLRAVGHDAVEAGNIGLPLADVALRARPPAWCSLELSSFQLHDTPGIDPTVGVLTNLSPDHLDRYPGVEAYYADKALLYRNARPGSRWVTNADQPEARTLFARRPGAAESREPLLGTTWRFSLTDPSEAWFNRETQQLVLLGKPLLHRRDLHLVGDHNIANALAAALAVMIADPTHQTDAARMQLAGALEAFRPLQHRLETVAQIDDVVWINDSKATNVSSTLVAVQGMTRPVVVLLGGRHKGEPYSALIEPLKRHARLVIAYGEAALLIARDLGADVPLERMGSSFEDVIARARAAAQPGDAILLSPACSSYDMFPNYEVRGATFAKLASGGP